LPAPGHHRPVSRNPAGAAPREGVGRATPRLPARPLAGGCQTAKPRLVAALLHGGAHVPLVDGAGAGTGRAGVRLHAGMADPPDGVPQGRGRLRRRQGGSMTYSRVTEAALLGGLLVAPRAVAGVADLLVADDFRHPAHRVIYAAIPALDAEGGKIDVITVGNHL